MMQRMAKRSKNYLLYIVIIPIVLGVLGWLLPVGKEPVIHTYTAEATISLGRYDNQDFNDPKRVLSLLTNPLFYEENLATIWEENQEAFFTNLQVTVENEQLIKLTYTDFSKENAASILNEITSEFMELDQKQFQQKEMVLNESIRALEQEEVGEEEKVSKHRFLYELKTAQLEIKPGSLVKEPDVKVDAPQTRVFSSQERAVLGVMLGIAFSILWIVVPVLVREQS